MYRTQSPITTKDCKPTSNHILYLSRRFEHPPPVTGVYLEQGRVTYFKRTSNRWALCIRCWCTGSRSTTKYGSLAQQFGDDMEITRWGTGWDCRGFKLLTQGVGRRVIFLETGNKICTLSLFFSRWRPLSAMNTPQPVLSFYIHPWVTGHKQALFSERTDLGNWSGSSRREWYSIVDQYWTHTRSAGDSLKKQKRSSPHHPYPLCPYIVTIFLREIITCSFRYDEASSYFETEKDLPPTAPPKQLFPSK